MAETPPGRPWQAPQDLGALPLELQAARDEILTRQLAAAEEIARRLTATRQQQAVRPGSRPARPSTARCTSTAPCERR
jgi:hypothetical protein